MANGETQNTHSHSKLPKPLIKDFQNRWQSFQAAREAAAIPPITHTTVLKSMQPVFAFSDFVAASCIREPAMLVFEDFDRLVGRRAEEEELISAFDALIADLRARGHKVTRWDTPPSSKN